MLALMLALCLLCEFHFELRGAVAAKVVQCALERGLIVRALPSDVVSVCPPLIVTQLEKSQAISGA